MSNILSFDSSARSCSVSITDGQNVLAFNEEKQPSMQAENLLPLIEATLHQAGCSYTEIDYLAVTTGPGSFTGIRIALATACGILHTSSIKGLGITNFETCYYRLKQQVRQFGKAFVIINAYRNQQYIQEFRDNQPQEPQLLNNKDVINILQKSNRGTVCCGSGLANIYDEIKHLPNLTILPRFPVIKAHHIGRLAHEMIAENNIKNIEPLYIRPPDAIIPSKQKT